MRLRTLIGAAALAMATLLGMVATATLASAAPAAPSTTRPAEAPSRSERGHQRPCSHPLSGLEHLLRPRLELRRHDDRSRGATPLVSRGLAGRRLQLRLDRRRLVVRAPATRNGTITVERHPMARRHEGGRRLRPLPRACKAGIYTDAGSDGCGGTNQGSYGHYQQDVNQFAAWGYDAVKVDFCGGTRHEPRPRHAVRAVPRRPAEQQQPSADAVQHLQPVRRRHIPGAARRDARRTTRTVRAHHRQLLADRHRHRLRAQRPVHATCCATSTTTRKHPEAAGPGSLERPRLPRPGARHVSSRGADPVLDVVDGRGAADHRQRRPSTVRPEHSTCSPTARCSRSTRTAGRAGHARSRHSNGQVWAKPLANGDRGRRAVQPRRRRDDDRHQRPADRAAAARRLQPARPVAAHHHRDGRPDRRAVAPHSVVLLRISPGRRSRCTGGPAVSAGTCRRPIRVRT